MSDNNVLHNSQKIFNKKSEKKEKKPRKVVEAQTTSLFLRYNRLKFLEGLYETVELIFPEINNLQWIDLSNNRLTTLVEDFSLFSNLRNLYLHVNYIANFAEFEQLQKN